MQHTFNENGKEIVIALERWVWGVVYRDGTELKQFDDQGKFHQFREILWINVELFVMYKYEDQSKSFTIRYEPGMKVSHFYRNTRSDDWGSEFYKTYIFGFEKDGVKVYNHILPDDRIIQSSIDDVDLVDFGANNI